MTQDEMKILAEKNGAYFGVGYVAKGEVLFSVKNLEAYTKAVEERTGVIDCRTCNFYHTLKGGCTCNIVCITGDRYRGKDVVRLYNKVS